MDETENLSPLARCRRRILAALGPGLITAAVVLGPGSITVSSKSGALMGYSVLWVVVAAGVMMVVFTRMGARVGLASDRSLLSTVAEFYGRPAAVLVGLCGFLIATGFQTGNNIGAGMAFDALFGGGMALWACVFTAIAMAMMWTSSSLYNVLERLMVGLVTVMIVCFLGDLLMIRPDWVSLARGFVPGKPAIFGLVVALSATTFSVAAAAFQAYLVQAKGWSRADLAKGVKDSTLGICMLVLISMTIMVTSATVLHPQGIKIDTAVDMARQLEPLLGRAAKWLFLLGLWAGAFSSFIVNAMIGGVLLADGLGLGGKLNSRNGKALASMVMLLGTAVALIAGRNPVQLLVLAQGTTILGVPLIALVLILLANRKDHMKGLRNGFGANLVAAAAMAWLVFLSYSQFCRLFLQ